MANDTIKYITLGLTVLFLVLMFSYIRGETAIPKLPKLTKPSKGGPEKINELKGIIKNTCSTLRPGENHTFIKQMCDKIDRIKIKEDTQSYTINKEKIYLCLTDKDKEFYSNNMLMYVLLHEFAHTLCKSIGHTKEFHDIFEKLLKEAIDKKLYDPSIPVDTEYCKHNK